ncbi:MAG: hypothetical protein GX171_03975 [Clostridiales bacterium]|jgi:D-alanyl-D-alanine carboxypeptidase (penicillin-binding protein 5/6)|nr:hypothetical protein [Clostridiales bacterium]
MKRLLTTLLLLALLVTSVAAQEYPLLKVGSTGAAVTKLQERLSAAGFLTGLADGKYGEGTKNAVARAQQAIADKGHQLRVDGIAGPATQTLLFDDAVMRPFIDFSLGASGQRVIALQNRLIDLKFLDGSADGQFGKQTLEALKAFQRHLLHNKAEGITENGLADAATRHFLDPATDLRAFHILAPEFFDDSRPQNLAADYLNARAAVVVNAGNGTILFAKHLDEKLYPASTTKMMTLLLALEKGNLDQKVTLPASTGEVAKDSSLVPVYPGEAMTMRDLLYGLMLRSGNDAANAIAELCAGSLEAFVAQMNQRALELGMKNTHFMNPHGYHDSEHYSTARDLAILSLHGMSNPEFAKIASALSYDMPATQKRGVLQIINTSELLSPGSPHFFEGAVGIKSGYTSHAGFCYAGSARQGDEVVFAVIMGSRTRNRGWDDMARLFRYGFSAIK